MPDSAPLSQRPISDRVAFRSVFVSDLHLGAAGCKDEAIYEFFRNIECDRLYLVGDIVDGWVGAREGKWKQSHSNIIRSILGKSKRGTSVMYTPGNHDSFMRRLNGAEMGDTLIDQSFEHLTEDGERILVIHGDLFDKAITKYHPFAYVAAWAYEMVSIFNVHVNAQRSKRERRPVDFSSVLKLTTKRIFKKSSSYEEDLIEHARELGYTGVICGHVHRPMLKRLPDGFLYANTGDWVENCTALVENLDGSLELIWWKNFSSEIDARSAQQTGATVKS